METRTEGDNPLPNRRSRRDQEQSCADEDRQTTLSCDSHRISFLGRR
jgi:hypothetical protein